MSVYDCYMASLQKQFASHFLSVQMPHVAKLPRLFVEYPHQFRAFGSIATEKGSVLKESLDRILQIIFDSGLLEMWSRQTELDMREEYRGKFQEARGDMKAIRRSLEPKLCLHHLKAL